MSAPLVPQRPVRSQQLQQPQAPPAAVDGPHIPPRPARRVNRSQSPSREAFARSPLNDSPFIGSIPPIAQYKTQHGPPTSKLARPPSVQNLPLIGQEGDEYAAFDTTAAPAMLVPPTVAAAAAPNETRNIAGDLPLHAPKASTPADVAKTQISTVTRTDSAQAAAIGIGKARNEYDEPEGAYRPPSAKPMAGRPASTISQERPGSASRPESFRDSEPEQGIPHIGLHVPMYPNAGDVQAPSPGANHSGPSTGVGYFNDGKSPQHIGRRKSRDLFSRPPDAYGLHGHGSGPADQFERAWYQRHPEEAIKEEHGAYGPGANTERAQWALSSDDLNKLVHKHGPGFGTTGSMGVPSEQLGYIASEEFASRQGSPRPPSLHSKSRTGSQSYAESPLRRTSFPINDSNISNQTKEQVALLSGKTDDAAMESDEDNTIHLDPVSRHASRIHAEGPESPLAATDLEGAHHYDRYEVPILASDELAKDPGSEFMVAAVEPDQLDHGDSYYGSQDLDHYSSHLSGSRSAGSSRPGSRPSSRPASIHAAPISLSRFVSRDDYEKSGTPLHEIDEYEPLFEDEESSVTKTKSRIEKLKRPDEMQRFPSRDIWEDTPDSLQLQTTVDSELAADDLASRPAKRSAAVFETPDAESARRAEILESQRRQNHQEGFAKPKFKPDVHDDWHRRPGLRQRFPSQDIWEDTPDSLMIQTTVESPQTTSPLTSPQEAQVAMASLATAASGRTIAPSEIEIAQDSSIATAATEASRDVAAPAQAQPVVPPRPSQKLRQIPAEISPPAEGLTKIPSPTDKRAPTIPDRPKPQIPPRPTRQLSDDQAGGVSLAKTTSASSAGSDTLATSPPKPKPAVPARPMAGSKIANLKAGFMDSLNSRLQKGPPVAAPKPTEQARDLADDEDKAPLADARKGRARGPVRRKPATADAEAAPASAWGVVKPWTVWHVSDAADLSLGAVPAAAKEEESKVVESAAVLLTSTHDQVDPLAAAADGHEPVSKAMDAVPPPAEAKGATAAAPAAPAGATSEAGEIGLDTTIEPKGEASAPAAVVEHDEGLGGVGVAETREDAAKETAAAATATAEGGVET